MATALKRELSAADLFSLGFGAIIGVGWIIIMGDWLRSAGPVGTMIALGVGAAVIIVIGLSYVQMATLLPVAGGEIAYAYESFGLRIAFAAGWIMALSYVAVVAFEAIAVGWILSIMVPASKGPLLYSVAGNDVHLGPLACGIIGTLVLTWTNYKSVKSTAIFQNLATAALVLISLVFLAAAIFGGKAAHLQPLIVLSESGSLMPGLIAVMATVPFFFIGFNIIPQALGERAPGTDAKSIRKTIIFAIVASCIFYCAMVFAAALLVPRGAIVSAELPVYAATVAAFRSEAAGQIVLIAGFLGLVTTWNAVFFASTRVFLALSRMGTIPPLFSRIDTRHGTPASATFLVGLLGVVGTCFGRGAILPIVNALGAATTLVFAMVCFGVLRIRKARSSQALPKSDRHRFVAAAGAILSLILSGLALYQATLSSPGRVPTEWILLLVWSTLGACLWWLARSYRHSFSEDERRALLLSDLTACPSEPAQSR